MTKPPPRADHLAAGLAAHAFEDDLQDDPPHLVIIESPFRGDSAETTERNVEYARRALRDSLERGEAPFASHLLYPQVWNETLQFRFRGILAGYSWWRSAHAIIFYMDYGESPGMAYARKRAGLISRLQIFDRLIGKNPTQ